MKITSIRLLLPCHLLFFSLCPTVSAIPADTSTSSTPASDQLLIPSQASAAQNVIEPICFPPNQFPTEPDAHNCLGAARLYQNDPWYDESIVYDKNPQPGIIARKVPVMFQVDNCGIVVDAVPEADCDIFTLESGWRLLSQTINQCILQSKPGHKYGGCAPIGSYRGFFTAVGTRPHDGDLGNGTDEDWIVSLAGAAARSCGRRLQASRVETN